MQKNAEFSHTGCAAGWAPRKTKKREIQISLLNSNPLSHFHHWFVFYLRCGPGLQFWRVPFPIQSNCSALTSGLSSLFALKGDRHSSAFSGASFNWALGAAVNELRFLFSGPILSCFLNYFLSNFLQQSMLCKTCHQKQFDSLFCELYQSLDISVQAEKSK